MDANSIVVNTGKTVVLAPTEATFMINLAVDVATPMSQVLSIVDFGLTANDLVSINSYPGYTGPYGPTQPGSRITYAFRLSVPTSKMKETIDKLEKLRKATDTGVDLSYSTVSVGPSVAAAEEAREKALPEMLADARKRAQSIAAASQLKLGGIVGVIDSYGYPISYGTAMQPVLTFSIVVRFAAQP